MLPAPVQVYQETNLTCWAACFRSLLRTNRSALQVSEDTLRDMFQAFLAPNGMNNNGVSTMANVAGLSISRMPGTDFSMTRMRNALGNGYVLLAYLLPPSAGMPPGTGHMVVAYGVDGDKVMVMNPSVGGATGLSLSFLRTCPRVSIGTNMFAPAANALSANPWQALTPAPTH
jgi:hypothetical protein